VSIVPNCSTVETYWTCTGYDGGGASIDVLSRPDLVSYSKVSVTGIFKQYSISDSVLSQVYKGARILYPITTLSTKILLLWNQVIIVYPVHRSTRRVLYWAIAILISYYFGSDIVESVLSTSQLTPWEAKPVGRIYFRFYLADVLISMSTDILIICMANYFIWPLRTTRTKKLRYISSLIAGGFCAAILNIIRLVFILQENKSVLEYDICRCEYAGLFRGISFNNYRRLVEVMIEALVGSLPAFIQMVKFVRGSASVEKVWSRVIHGFWFPTKEYLSFMIDASTSFLDTLWRCYSGTAPHNLPINETNECELNSISSKVELVGNASS